MKSFKFIVALAIGEWITASYDEHCIQDIELGCKTTSFCNQGLAAIYNFSKEMSDTI